MDGVMSHTEDRISDEMAEQILAKATRLYREASRLEQAAERSAQAGFSHGELQRACIEADIPTQYLDEAFLVVQEDRSRLEQEKLQHHKKLADRRKKVRHIARQILTRSTTVAMNSAPKAIGVLWFLYCFMGIGDYLKIQGAGLKVIADKNAEIATLKQALEKQSKDITQQVEVNTAHENERKIHQESKTRHQVQVKVLNDEITKIESELELSKEEVDRLQGLLNSRRTNSKTTTESTPEEPPSVVVPRSNFKSLVMNKTEQEVKAVIGDPAEIKVQGGVVHWTYYRKTTLSGHLIDPRVTIKMSIGRVISVAFD
jgi:hypothetical protein